MKTVISVMLALTLAACGSDNGGQPPPSGPEPLTLTGTWHGTIDFTVDHVESETLIVDGHEITDLAGNTGVLSDATETVRAFRFEVNEVDNGGVLLVGDGDRHVLYVDRLKGVGIFERDGGDDTAFQASELDGTWEGPAWSLDASHTLSEHRTITAVCDGDVCTFDGREATGVAMDHDLGRFIGLHEGGDFAALRAYMSRDRNATGWWSCDDYANDFPGSCAFAVLTRQE